MDRRTFEVEKALSDGDCGRHYAELVEILARKTNAHSVLAVLTVEGMLRFLDMVREQEARLSNRGSESVFIVGTATNQI